MQICFGDGFMKVFIQYLVICAVASVSMFFMLVVLANESNPSLSIAAFILAIAVCALMPNIVTAFDADKPGMKFLHTVEGGKEIYKRGTFGFLLSSYICSALTALATLLIRSEITSYLIIVSCVLIGVSLAQIMLLIPARIISTFIAVIISVSAPVAGYFVTQSMNCEETELIAVTAAFVLSAALIIVISETVRRKYIDRKWSE